MILTALGNLTQKKCKEGSSQSQFAKDQDIIPFIDQHWEAMTTMSRRVTQSWHATVSAVTQLFPTTLHKFLQILYSSTTYLFVHVQQFLY